MISLGIRSSPSSFHNKWQVTATQGLWTDWSPSVLHGGDIKTKRQRVLTGSMDSPLPAEKSKRSHMYQGSGEHSITQAVLGTESV